MPTRVLEKKTQDQLESLKNFMLNDLLDEIKRLKRLIVRDELTGVLNRKGILEEFGAHFKEVYYLRRHLPSRRRMSTDDISLLFIDCDNFKKINDTYGHDVGDKVLKGIAHVLQRKIRAVDLVGRFGGEEFIVMLFGATEEEVYKKAEYIRKQLTALVTFKRYKKLTVTASIGVASLAKTSATSLKQLIACADKAMYEAKHHRGKNAVVKHSELK